MSKVSSEQFLNGPFSVAILVAALVFLICGLIHQSRATELDTEIVVQEDSTKQFDSNQTPGKSNEGRSSAVDACAVARTPTWSGGMSGFSVA